MALIKCYECDNQVSERAKSCPHCGAPISDCGIKSNKPINLCYILYDGFTNTNLWRQYKSKATRFILEIYGSQTPHAQCVKDQDPCYLFKGISKDTADCIFQVLTPMGCELHINYSDEYPYNSELDRKAKAICEEFLILKCPRCHSTAITTGTKGYGLIRGFLGSNKTVNRCGRCGYSWEP